ncbi:WD repeat protein [Tritrichomonas foetus]|uniref:Beta'-coat protein n=1 Tax=Tritrichomonas foetus TaxID=1144522 RepID=A0A1J4JYX7_9EUKA|nr:WD repeat protein [Tritrichomonas foetus]|eukprot:OHT04375.1 WD repeat protein [Tritrichomonas foetus]
MSLSKYKRLYTLQSARVKCLDFHPTQPLLLASLYSGDAFIVDCTTGTIIKTIQVHTGVPLRTGRWISHNGNVVFGGDKCSFNFYSPTKGKLILEVPDAHKRYVRSIAIHPTELSMLSCSDDLTCKLWDITSGCQLVRTFDYHNGLVMDIKWNPRDPTTFASCSLDGTAIFWDVSSPQPRFTQKISSKAVNCISFIFSGDRPLLAASSDDCTVQVFDLQTRSLLSTLEGHEKNVSRVEFHPTRPILVSVGEDSVCYLWSSHTFKKENVINAGLERGWALSISPSSPLVAVGYDRGLSIVKFVHTGIPISLDSSGKTVIAHGSDLSTTSIKNHSEIVDGQELSLTWKEAITAELVPIELLHSPNSRYVTALSDGEYTIFTTLGFRSRSYGKGFKFAWSQTSTCYAVLDVTGSIRLFSNFEEASVIDRFCRKIWGGALLSASVDRGIEFYDWDTGKLIRRIESKGSEVKWSGDLVAIRTKDSIFILQYNQPDSDSIYSEESGYEESFTLLHEIEAKSTSICWSSGILFYSENTKINRFVSGVVQSTATLKSPADILGYLPRDNLLVLADQQRKIIGINLPYTLIEFEASVAEGEEPDPEDVPEEYRSRCAKFLKQIGQKELALSVTSDPSMKFELALELGKLDIAQQTATDASMWKRLARAALNCGDFEMSKLSLKNCGDYSTLLMLYKAKNCREEMEQLIEESEAANQLNVAFTAALLTDHKKKACEILMKSGKFAEAALFARSNIPEMTSECVKLWKQNVSSKIADGIADPSEYPNLFDELIEH